MTIRPTDIRRHAVSAKWRLGEMTFHENDAPSLVPKILVYTNYSNETYESIFFIPHNSLTNKRKAKTQTRACLLISLRFIDLGS